MKNFGRTMILGAVVGALTILILTFGIIFGMMTFSGSLLTSRASMVIGTITVLLAPVAGGFIAGLVGGSNPKKAGLFAGLGASLVILIAWLALSGFKRSTMLSGVVIIFIWVVLARLASSFVRPQMKP
jgi:hypothetical protein